MHLEIIIMFVLNQHKLLLELLHQQLLLQPKQLHHHHQLRLQPRQLHHLLQLLLQRQSHQQTLDHQLKKVLIQIQDSIVGKRNQSKVSSIILKRKMEKMTDKLLYNKSWIFLMDGLKVFNTNHLLLIKHGLKN